MPNLPVLDEGIASARAELRSHVGLDRKDAARRLVDFAARFAADPKLQAQALVLNLDAHGDMPDDDAADIEGRLHALIDEVVVDYLGHGGREALQQREHMHERLRERFVRRAPGESVAFRGEGIVKTYPGSGFTLGELDLTLRVGEITGVVGQNAHGKTTLLRIVAGELRPDRGMLAYPLFGVGGGDAGALDWVRLKANIAYVPQELPPWHGSLRDTLHYEAAIHGVLGRENEREVAFVVERLGLAEHLDKRWRELSGGYKLRFALARALVWKPCLLVMDEPLSNLDVKAKSVLLQDVRDLARSYRYPIAVLMSSHELYDLEQVCQQMVSCARARSCSSARRPAPVTTRPRMNSCSPRGRRWPNCGHGSTIRRLRTSARRASPWCCAPAATWTPGGCWRCCWRAMSTCSTSATSADRCVGCSSSAMAGRWLHAATALLLPLCSRLLDRRLLLRHPLLWRSRLLPVAWSAIPATLLAVAVGVTLGDGMSSENAWTGVEIVNAVSLCVYAAIVCAALWARVVMAHVAGPLTPARRLRAIGFNGLALLLIFVPPYALHAVLSHRVATVMPDAEFAEDWSYHQSHRFWACMSGDARFAVVRERARLEASLPRFGVATQGEVTQCNFSLNFFENPLCEQNNQCLVMQNADGTTDYTQLLERRLESIRMHKARWRPVRLATWLPDGGLLALQLGVTAALAALLSLPGVDRQNVGPGELLRSTLGRWRRRLSLRPWLPAFVRDYDRRLLLTAPLAWATGAPIVALGAAALGLLLAGLMAATALLPGSVSKQGQGLSVFWVSFVTAIQPVWWALVAQRRPVPLLRRRQMFALLGGLCVTCLAVPVVLLLAGRSVRPHLRGGSQRVPGRIPDGGHLRAVRPGAVPDRDRGPRDRHGRRRGLRRGGAGHHLADGRGAGGDGDYRLQRESGVHCLGAARSGRLRDIGAAAGCGCTVQGRPVGRLGPLFPVDHGPGASGRLQHDAARRRGGPRPAAEQRAGPIVVGGAGVRDADAAGLLRRAGAVRGGAGALAAGAGRGVAGVPSQPVQTVDLHPT